MERKIRIKIPDLGIQVEGMLNDTETALVIWEALPILGKANRWGDEIYFTIPVRKELESTASDTVSLADIGYWPVGRALCLFFGPTPITQKGEIKAASPVNLVGKITSKDFLLLKKVKDGQGVQVEKK